MLSTWWLVIRSPPNVKPSKVLMAVINFLFKSPSWSLLLLESAKFTFDMTSQSQQGSCWKDAARVEFTRGFGHVSEAAFTMCGNPKLLQQVNHRNQPSLLFGQHGFINFFNLSRLILKKGGFTSLLANHKKRDFSLEKSILGWKSTTG